MKWGRSLRARLSLATGLVLAVVLAAFSAAVYGTLRASLRRSEESRLDALANRIALAAEWRAPSLEDDEERPAGSGRPQRAVRIDAEDLLLEFSDREVFVARAGPSAFWLVPGTRIGVYAESEAPPAWLLADGLSEIADRTWLVGRRDRPLKNESRAPGPGNMELFLAIDVTEDHKALSFLAWILWNLCPLLSLAGALGVWAAVGRGLKPLERTGAELRAVDAGRLSFRVSLPGTQDELESLVLALNHGLEGLEKSFERERAFLADAAHEIRTPLAALLTTLEVALSQNRSAEEYRVELASLLGTVNRLRNLSEGLLTLARADAGGLVLRRSKVEVGGLLREAVKDFSVLAEGKKIGIFLSGPETLFYGGDEVLLRRLFDNVISNGIIHNREGGRLDISCDRREDSLIVRVSDTGPGINPEHLPHLFERFYRSEKGRARSSGGAGLGLSIAQTLARIHGGEIRVESRPGGGAAFEIHLPYEKNR